jgi:Flp pilus assembly protein TadB
VTASEAVWACIAVAVGLLVIATTGFDQWHRPRTHRRFQRTAQQAARRTEADVRRDLTKARAKRQAVEDAEFDRIIAAEFPAGIPHQTRRTEEDQ